MSTDYNAEPLMKNEGRAWPTELCRIISVEEQDDDWTMAKARIRSHPEEVARVGAIFGQTILMVSCIRYPPLSTIQEIVAIAPQIVLMQNHNGETALHIACSGSSEEVQMELIRAAPQTVALLDKYGESPLHIAARNGSSLRLLEAMLQSIHPSLISAKNDAGFSPFCLLSRSYIEAMTLEEVEEDDDYIDDWETALLFLRYSAQSSSVPLVHAAAMTSSCPLPLLKMLMKFFPEQALQYDCQGRIPLHYAALTDVFQDEYTDDNESMSETLTNKVLQLVTKWNPKAAKMADVSGRLPLTMAMLAQKTWHDGIMHLVWAAPQALETRDMQTHFYPFQTAALHCDLDTIYQVLRCFPPSLASAMKCAHSFRYVSASYIEN